MAIQKLPEEVRSAVRSGIAISTTAQCISELVMNSLDAGANSVVINLDIPHFKLEVDDNGCGMTLDDLQNVGIRYHTSKCRTMQDLENNLKYKGYRGEALASLSECCGFLVVVTRPKHTKSNDTYFKTFSCGRAHKPIKASSIRNNHGTTVSVLDFMCNAPVRQRRIIPNVDIEEIRIEVEGIALSHPHVSFTIIDESDKSIILRIPSSSSSLETFTQLYGLEISKNLSHIGPFTAGKFNISGFISTSSYHNKKLQFIFVNGRLVKGTKIHKLINMIMRKSDVLRGSGPWQVLPMPDRMRDFLWVSPLKKKERHCVFMVHISCPVSEYDITLDPRKTLIEFLNWDMLFECMENTVKSFLKEHNLACIAPDQEIMNSQSNGDSPLSLINEMDQLERDEALALRLRHFRCPVEVCGGHGNAVASGSKILTLAAAIHGIPAKRNLGNALASSEFQGHRPSKEEVVQEVGNSGNAKCIQNGIRAVSDKGHANKPAEPISIDKVKLIKFPLLQERNATPVNSLKELQGSSHEKNFRSNVQDSGSGSLGRFRKAFKKTVSSLQTPDDIQKIVVDEPPPIIRRKAPLEHRIKGCKNNGKLKNPSVNTITVPNKQKNAGICKKNALLSKKLKAFAFDRNMINNTGNNICSSQKNILIDDTATCSRSDPSSNAVLLTATHTESNHVCDREQKCTEEIPSHSKGMMRPNLKKLNLRRKQFQETNSYHNRIKVCKYGFTNGGPENEIEDKTSGVGSQSDHHQYENNELDKLCFKTEGQVSQKQTQAKSSHVQIREKICTEGQSENKSTYKPNLTNLSLKRKHFEETMDCNSKTEMNKHDDLNKVAKQSVHIKRTHYDSPQNINHTLKNMSLPETKNESEKNSMEMKFLTSEDFLFCVEMGKKVQGSEQRKIVSDDRKDTCAASSSQLEENFRNPMYADYKQMSGCMPVLEPYYSSNLNSTSAQLSIRDSPPSLMDDENCCQELEVELQSELSALSKQPASQVSEKIPLNSSVNERNSTKYEESNQRASSAHKETFEKLEEYISLNLTEPKSDSCLLKSKLSTSDTAEICHDKNGMKIHSLVPMYNSDSEDDTPNEMHDVGRVLQYSGNASCSENFNGGEMLVNTETQIIKSKCFSPNISPNIVECMDSAVEFDSKVFSGQVSPGLNFDISQCEKVFPEDNGTNLDVDKKQFVQSDISSSQKLCSPLISHDEQLEYLYLQKNDKSATLAGDVASTISPKISVVEHGGEEKSPFFADSSEWDVTLSEMCHKLESFDTNKSTELQSERTVDSNGDQNLCNRDVNYQQEKRFEMFARPAFCPKGLSPVMPVNFQHHKKDKNELCHKLSSQEGNELHSIIKQCSTSSDELSWIKWSKSNVNSSEGVYGTATTPEKSDQDMLASLLAERQDKKLISETEILSARIENQSKSFVRVFNLIHPCTFSKEVLSNFKMIGNLDCKFIVAKVSLENEKCSNAIVLFDQHAVHERIRLERLTQENQISDKVAGENSKGYVKYKSSPATPTFEITLNASEARILESFHEQFERLGLAFDVQSGNESSSGDVVIKINEVPTCLLYKELKESGPSTLKEQVHSLIREQVEHLLDTRGVGLYSPNILRDAINMKACRGAVKFGDSLSDQECHWLLRKLSACDTPFQCAHGRPSMYPIIELKQLNRFYNKIEEDSKPHLWRLKKMMEHAASHQKKLKTNV